MNEDNYLRIERAYGSFSRSFSLANSVKSEAIKADYQNGVLTLSLRAQGVGWKRIATDMGVGVGTLYRLALEGSKIRERFF